MLHFRLSRHNGKRNAAATHHLSALDGLRGFAALIVVVSHSANAGFLPVTLGEGLGQMGVTLFFGLSGFLMGYLYSSKPLNLPNLWEYAVNRTTRVLPLYYVVVAITTVSFLVFDFALLNADSIKRIIGNIALIRGSSILWTIPVEVHFYVVFVGLWFASAARNFTRAVLVIGVSQLSILLLLYSYGISNSAFLFSWLHVFMFGSLLGVHYERIKSALENSSVRPLLSGLAWLLLLLAVVAPPQVRRDLGMTLLPNFIDPVTVGYPLALLACTVFLLGPFSLFKVEALRWYGKVSYSLYLLHKFAVLIVAALVSASLVPNFLGFPLVLGLATLMAIGGYYGLERPVQKALRDRLLRRRRSGQLGKGFQN